jgi:hypothetical protein
VYSALLHPAGRAQGQFDGAAAAAAPAAAAVPGHQQLLHDAAEGEAGRRSPRFGGGSQLRASRAGLQAGAGSKDACGGELLVVITGGYDGQIRLWDGLSGRPLGSVRASEGLVNCLAFDYLGGRLYCGDSRGMLQVGLGNQLLAVQLKVTGPSVVRAGCWR